mmetsp:Transcript_136858/g.193563  ORF Transcript_136858/g.193563 Transcript_136858/m.193563 type:complete len:110 (+) Transcript_136858:254-583(+)
MPLLENRVTAWHSAVVASHGGTGIYASTLQEFYHFNISGTCGDLQRGVASIIDSVHVSSNLQQEMGHFKVTAPDSGMQQPICLHLHAVPEQEKHEQAGNLQMARRTRNF